MGRAPLVSALLAAGSDPRATDEYGSSPLQLSWALGERPAAHRIRECLVAAGADYLGSRRRYSSISPLEGALHTGRRQELQLYLDDLVRRAAAGRLPEGVACTEAGDGGSALRFVLHAAIELKHSGLATFSAQLTAAWLGRNPAAARRLFGAAIAAGEAPLVARLLSLGGLSPHEAPADEPAVRPLQLAIQHGQADCLSVLISHGAVPVAEDVVASASAGSVACMRVLLRAGGPRLAGAAAGQGDVDERAHAGSAGCPFKALLSTHRYRLLVRPLLSHCKAAGCSVHSS